MATVAGPSAVDLRGEVEKIRREHFPPERYVVRREAEAAARDLIGLKLGRLDNSDISQFAQHANRDVSRYGMPTSHRWGLGLAQPRVNALVKTLGATNRIIRRLWEAPIADVFDLYEELRRERADKAPGGDMLASLILYLRAPESFAVFVPSLERGARALGIVKSDSPVSYREFNDAVQAWQKEYSIDHVETDVILTVSDPHRPAKADANESNPLSEAFESVMADYLESKTSQSFGSNAPIWATFEQFDLELSAAPTIAAVKTLSVKASPGSGNWANVPWVAVFDSRVTRSIRDGVYCVYLFRQDMSGVYLTLNQGVSEPFERLGRDRGKEFLVERADEVRAHAGALTGHGFLLDNKIDLRAAPGLGSDYEISTIAHKFYEAGAVPDDASLLEDLGQLIRAYLRYVDARQAPAPVGSRIDLGWDMRESGLEQAVQTSGFVFEPWQLAAFTTAVRTKPFVILAGVTGTGKTQLPVLVATLTGGSSAVIAVRPDWTDSGDVLGYTDLQGQFRPGALLIAAHAASLAPDQLHMCVLDEMNIGRVEHYLAEVLSAIERRSIHEGGGFESAPLLPNGPEEWRNQRIPPNLVLVGTVNMDESAHGFSRKVVDRAFTIELSDVDLARVNVQTVDAAKAEAWPASAWFPSAIQLGALPDEQREKAATVIPHLVDANRHLAIAQLQLGYRSRDEIALFVLNASDLAEHFVTRDGSVVDPFDLAFMMKALPRIAGGSAATRRCLLGLFGWALGAEAARSEDDARRAVDAWVAAGRPSAMSDASYPRSAARICLMWERLESDGFASYWL